MESGVALVLVTPQAPVVPESAVTAVIEKDKISSTVAETMTASIGATLTSTVSIF